MFRSGAYLSFLVDSQCAYVVDVVGDDVGDLGGGLGVVGARELYQIDNDCCHLRLVQHAPQLVQCSLLGGGIVLNLLRCLLLKKYKRVVQSLDRVLSSHSCRVNQKIKRKERKIKKKELELSGTEWV